MVLFLAIQTFCVAATAQLEYLRLSPAQTITQRVGVTTVTLEFSRPQRKGRQIFGGLVPYGQLWRTGANENTKISFDYRVRIGETELPKGTYALLTLPQPTSWDIYVYTDTNNLDVPDPIDSTKLIYLTTVKPYELPAPEETLVINIYDITETSANLGISWARAAVKVPLTFYTRAAMEDKIATTFRQNALDYSIAAAYYAQRGLELEKAKALQELSMELREQPSAWAYHDDGIILQKLGEQQAAARAFMRSLQLAQTTQNEYLIEENQKRLDELKK